MNQIKNNFVIYKFLIIAAVLQIVWGFVPSASKIVIDEIPVELYIGIRWTISSCFFILYLAIKKKWKKLSLKDYLIISILGFLGYGIASLGTLYGLKVGGVTNFALISTISPVITSIVSILILKERPQKLFFIALPLSVLGLSLLVIGKNQISSFAIAGTSAILIVLAYVLEAFVFVFSKRFKEKISIAQYLAIAQISTAVLMWILQATSFHQFNKISDLSFNGFLSAIFVSIVACVLCYAILYWLLNYIDGHKLAFFDGFHTLSATLFGYFLFSEKLRPLMIIGGALILVSLIAGTIPNTIDNETIE